MYICAACKDFLALKIYRNSDLDLDATVIATYLTLWGYQEGKKPKQRQACRDKVAHISIKFAVGALLKFLSSSWVCND